MPGTWKPLTNQPTFGTGTMITLTDGRIMVQDGGSNHWYALTPDNTGSYLNGTWSTLADMHHSRLYYASGIMKDGRLFVFGGEYSDAGGDTNTGEIYDPVTNAWTEIPSPPGWPLGGDACCVVFPDGRIMIGALATPDCIIYDPATNAWTPAASKAVRSNEETWVLQPDNTVLTVQCFPPHKTEKYIIATNTWKDEGPLPVTLVNPNMFEIGPAMLLPNGRTIYFGAQDEGGFGKTAIYTPPAVATGTGTWVAGPDIPLIGGVEMICNDSPATLMPNGKVLIAVAQYIPNNWGAPTYFCEYDPVSNTIVQTATPPNNGAVQFESRFMLTPSGEVLYAPGSTDIRCYIPDGGLQDAWRPKISWIAPHFIGAIPDYYTIRGTQLNGLSQANLYGDDCYPATNYPLVQLSDLCSSKVYYSRSYDFSTMGVATGTTPVTCKFSQGSVPDGKYELRVIANGIASEPVGIELPASKDECCSFNRLSLHMPEVCEACEAPKPSPWVDCCSGLRFYEPRLVIKDLATSQRPNSRVRGRVQFEILYQHSLCLRGRQVGKLLYTTSLLPLEELRIYQYDRYRQTTSETERYSVHTSFRQAVSTLFEAAASESITAALDNWSSSQEGGGGSFNLFGLLQIGGGGSSSSTSHSVVTAQQSAQTFSQLLASASSAVESERSLVISAFEDKEKIDTTSRLLKNANECRAVNYYVRQVNEVYELTSTVVSIRWRLLEGATTVGQTTVWHTIDELNSVPASDLVSAIKKDLATLPQVGDSSKGDSCITLPTDGSIIEAELAHCSSCDPDRTMEMGIALEKSKAEARKLCLEAELVELEIRRRKLLLNAGNLGQFEAPAAAIPTG